MNIIRMTGGLGNQMFQYALYLKLKFLGKEVKFDDQTEYEGKEARPILLWAFGIDYPAASRKEVNRITDGKMALTCRIRRKLFGRKSMEYHEKSCNFDEQVLKKEQAYLTGYFQSEKYFKDIEQQVREAFQFSSQIWSAIPRELAQKIKEYQEKIDDREKTAVSVHIRRGDYLENKEVYGGICTEEYYKKAIEVIRESFPAVTFFVFSNEAKWARDWIRRTYGKEEDFVVIEGTTEDTGYLDMFLMSRCRAHIIANSSFSWWGAWLNPDRQKMVIAPSKWVNNKDMADIYTQEMIKISPDGKQVLMNLEKQ